MLAMAAVAALGALAIVRSASQLSAMSIFSTTSRVTQLEQASVRDPGSYRIHVRLAEGYVRRGSCKRAIAHASAARALLPNAPQPRRLLASCGR
jgi:thioredoxin-like negative regulator of GroEL